MSSEIDQPQPQPQPQPGAGAGAGVARWIALGSAAVLVSMAVGGGVGYDLLQYKKQPASAAKVSTAAPAPVRAPAFGAHSDGDHYGPLSELLVPMPSADISGPDLPGVGSNAQLTAAQYVSALDDLNPYLTSSENKQLVQVAKESHVEGYAVRTYMPVTDTTSTVDTGNYYVQMAILQENQHQASNSLTVMNQMVEFLGDDRGGPAVSGFPHARCFLPYTTTGDQLSEMECVAAVGDLFVQLQEYGDAPLDTGDAVTLFKQQLTRLAIPAAQI